MLLPNVVVVNDLSFLPLGRGRVRHCRSGPEFFKKMFGNAPVCALFHLL